MICRPLPSKVQDWIAPRERPTRSGGWHVSTVLVAMLKATGIKRYDPWGKTREEARIPTDEVGYAWEDILSGPLAARVLVPPDLILLPSAELEVDGIFGTPDRALFDTTRRGFIVEEAKATYMSGKNVLDAQRAYVPIKRFKHDPKFSYWRLQTMTYAAMIRLSERWPAGWVDVICDRLGMNAPALAQTLKSYQPPLGRIRALFLNGCYTGELALLGSWELEWTAEELDTWWASLVRFAHTHPELQTPEEEPVL